MYDLLENLTLFLIDCLNVCDDRPVRYPSCTKYLHDYYRLFKDVHDLMQKKLPPLI